MKKTRELLHLLHQAIPTVGGRRHTIELEEPTGHLAVVVCAGYHYKEVYTLSDDDLARPAMDLVHELVDKISLDMKARMLGTPPP